MTESTRRPDNDPDADNSAAAEPPENQRPVDGDTSETVPESDGDDSAGLFDPDRVAIESLQIFNIFSSQDHRSGGVYVSGGTVRSHVLSGRDGRPARVEPEHAAAVPLVGVSAISADELVRLRDVTILVSCHRDADAILKQDRFVLISGPSGAGKWAGGVALFAEPRAVLAIDPSVGPESLLDFTVRIARPDIRYYIIESLTPGTARALNEFAARELTARLEEINAYLVITLDDRVPLDRDMLCRTVTWRSRPAPIEALRRHLVFYLGPESAEDVLRQLPIHDLQPHLNEREMRLTDRVARRVARAYRDGTDLQDAIASLGLGAYRQVEEWFGRKPTIAEVSFLLACAVLGGCTYTTVAAHAARIESLLADASRTSLAAAERPLTRTKSGRLSEVMAKLGAGLVNTEFGPSVTEIVTLESTPLVRAVLNVVWHEYDLIAEALLEWILEAGNDRDADVRIRVAFAAGQLAEYDFATVRQRLLLPWAKSEKIGPRESAAFALGVPAATDTTAGPVLGLLHHWATVTNAGLVWTTTQAYGSYVGLAFPHIAMSELLGIVTRSPNETTQAIRSVRHLFLLGSRRDPAIPAIVLAGLVDWLRSGAPPASDAVRMIFLGLLSTAGSPQQWDGQAFWEHLTGETSRIHTAVLLAHCLDPLFAHGIASLLVMASGVGWDRRGAVVGVGFGGIRVWGWWLVGLGVWG